MKKAFNLTIDPQNAAVKSGEIELCNKLSVFLISSSIVYEL